MVRAILDGSKTQTRRIIKNTGTYAIEDHHGIITANRERSALATQCRYGKPSDRLWVRETWAEVGTMDPGLIVYRADYPDCVPRQYENVPPASEITWKPSIHMFRKHSRIILEITGVRVERLQDISEAGAIAEGVSDILNPVGAYRELWESINGPASWAANPWVWVVEFKRRQA
jgi:hypothetical protein